MVWAFALSTQALAFTPACRAYRQQFRFIRVKHLHLLHSAASLSHARAISYGNLANSSPLNLLK